LKIVKLELSNSFLDPFMKFDPNLVCKSFGKDPSMFNC